MEYDLKAGVQGHVFFAKKLREVFGNEMTLLPNAEAAAIYPKGADPERVIMSLEVIIADLKLRVKKEVKQ